MHRFLRPLHARLAGEEGFTLVELVAALIVLSVGIWSIAQLTSNQLSKSLYTRERDVAIAEANRQVETLRATAFANLKLNPSASIPGSYTDSDGSVYTPLVCSGTGCPSTTYVNYQQTVTLSPFTFTVTTIIAAIDDASDGIGAADQNSNTVDYKKVILTISAPSSDRGGFTYKMETIMRDRSNDPITPVQGLEVHILDSTGDQVQLEDVTWTIDISGAGVQDDQVDEGEYQNFGLQTGTYTCTVKNTDDNSRDWYPQGSPGATSDSFACTVTSGQITTYNRTWVEPDDCAYTPGVTGDLTVNVIANGTGTGISGASVDPEPASGQGNPSPVQTGSLGGVTFSQIDSGPYDVTVSKTGYVTKTISGCVTATQGQPLLVSLANQPPSPSPSASPSPGIPVVNVSVLWTGKGTKTFKVYLSDSVVATQDISKNQTVTFRFTPDPGTYFVHVYCVAKSENLRAAVENQTFASGQTYNYGAYSVSKC